jgi:hypothetical protein
VQNHRAPASPTCNTFAPSCKYTVNQLTSAFIYIISRADPSMDTVQISYQCLNVKNSKTNMFRVNSVNNQLYFIKSIIESYRDSS